MPDGVWGDAAASWLGWDLRTGVAVPAATELQDALTERPRKYGCHATIKPPFRLAPNTCIDDVASGLETLCARFAPVPLASLQRAQLGPFFALTAPDEQAPLSALAEACVRDLDQFRAPLQQDEIDRRRKSRLSPAQDALMLRWGYPYVLEEFRFHITLSGPVRHDVDIARAAIDAALPDPAALALTLDSLSLVGEAEDGRFHQIRRIPLGSLKV